MSDIKTVIDLIEKKIPKLMLLFTYTFDFSTLKYILARLYDKDVNERHLDRLLHNEIENKIYLFYGKNDKATKEKINGAKEISTFIQAYHSKCKGCFHSKVYLLFYDEYIQVISGSANLTSAGFSQNIETLDNSKINYSNNSLALKELLLFIKENTSYVYDQVKKDLEYKGIPILVTNKKIKNVSPEYIFPISPKRTPFEQIKRVFNNKRIDKLCILSPYFDSPQSKDSVIFKKFQEQLKINKTVIFISTKIRGGQKMFGFPLYKYSFMFNKNGSIHKKFKLYIMGDIDVEGENRFVHAKRYYFKCGKYCYILSGSLNFSNAAWEGKNSEFGILYRHKAFDIESNITQNLSKIVSHI